MGFLKNIWTVMYTFINLYGVDQEIAMCNQMSLLLNELSQEKNTQRKRKKLNPSGATVQWAPKGSRTIW